MDELVYSGKYNGVNTLPRMKNGIGINLIGELLGPILEHSGGKIVTVQHSLYLFIYFGLFVFLGLHLWHMEVPGLGV